mgnify:CR=1 FL=1
MFLHDDFACGGVFGQFAVNGLCDSDDSFASGISLLAVVYGESASILSPMRQVMSAPLLVSANCESYLLTLILRV